MLESIMNKLTGFDWRLNEPRFEPGILSPSECSTVHPKANKAFKLSLTGSLYRSFSY